MIDKSTLITSTYILKSIAEQTSTTNVMPSFFIGSNIPTASVYGVYIIPRFVTSALIFGTELSCWSKLLKQDYDAPMLKSSLQKFYGRHHELDDGYVQSGIDNEETHATSDTRHRTRAYNKTL